MQKLPRFNFLYVSIFLLTPLVLTWAASFKIPIYLPGRTDMAVFGFFTLLFGLACSRIKWIYLKAAILILCSVIAFKTLDPYYDAKYRSRDKKLSAYLTGLVKNDDIVIFTGLTIPSLYYYLNHTDKKLEYLFYPSEMEEHLGHYDPEPFMNNSASLQQEINRIMDYLTHNLVQDKVAWIIYEDHYINKELLGMIRNKFQLHYEQDDKEHRLFLIDRPLKIYGFKK